MNKQNQQSIIIGIIIVAVVAVFFAILLTNQGGTSGPSGVNYDDIPQTRLADGGYVLGNPDAPITIVEFADFLCPHCQTYKSEINKVIEELVAPGKARLEFRMFPTQQSSDYLFRIAECIAESEGNNFWEAHDELFNLASNRVSTDDIGRELAKKFDMSYADMLECTAELGNDNQAQYITDSRVGQSSGVTGTPAIRIRRGDMNAEIETLSGYERSGPAFSVLEQLVNAAN